MNYSQAGPIEAQIKPKVSRLGGVALLVVSICAAVSIAGSLWIGLTIAPMQAEFGRTLLEVPDPYRMISLIVLGLQVLCAIGGITSLILAIIAIGNRTQVRSSVVALVIAAIAPLVSFAVFMFGIISYVV